MNIKNTISTILLPMIESNLTDWKKYDKLELKDVPSIKKSDLPSEFCEESFDIIDTFIKKTSGLEYEILIYFDYITGKILKCKIGNKNRVKMKFNEKEFKGKHIASIHNHPPDTYSPPSNKNFGLLSRDWEDYELIAGMNELWIMKGKINDKKLQHEFNIVAYSFYRLVEDYFEANYKSEDEIKRIYDEQYGNLLSKYINDKNINDIQLNKTEYHHE